MCSWCLVGQFERGGYDKQHIGAARDLDVKTLIGAGNRGGRSAVAASLPSSEVFDAASDSIMA